ncbi:MAG: hypothetical protein DMG71_19430 [Acidobacteria bacterium]|nr:MAG: hypothetical protein DMG71_19430 [Acidobacteriota bacterium]
MSGRPKWPLPELARIVDNKDDAFFLSRIRTLTPNVTREEATEQFSPGGPLELAYNLLFGRLRSVGDVYIPFKLFQLEVVNADRQERQLLALDAVTGNLDPYHFDQVPSSSEVIVLETRNCPPAIVDETRATELIVDKYRRLLFQRGFFRLRGLHISAVPFPGEIHIPYWVGFRGHSTRVHIQVMDAVRRRREGAKVRKLLEDWLASVP